MYDRMIENMKADGRYRHAGQLAALQGKADYYGCHYGMRSMRQLAVTEFSEGHAEITALFAEPVPSATNKYSRRSENEATTYRLFDELFQDSKNFTVARAAIAPVFEAMYSASLSADRVSTIASAMAGFEVKGVPEALTELVRLKVLRSRRVDGVTHYEVRY